MRENLKRLCIIFPKNLIQLADEHKGRYHGSRSQLLRQALIEHIDGLNDEEDGVAQMRPFVEGMENLEKTVEKIERGLMKQGRGTEFLVENLGGGAQKVARDIESLLLGKGEALSIPEMGEYLPYEQSELLRGIERLEENFAVERIKRGNGLPKWGIRGGKYDE